ncbi:MFS transporter [Microbacterium sp. KSW2-29]|uniref:MFS transporter n=1 Tax=Microbacterium phycohabitans TaxID=3075993 RepID=A0ABU3SMT7_9MICO|nr:MFS transporter [Microbacterium sp. KSW2-29]MDU0345702.1 MFS transporter [Microbacterium sp. KSW2-29]
MSPAAAESRGADPVDARTALACCLAAGFATLLDATVVAYTAPTVASSLDAATSGVQWFLAAYSLTFGLGLVPAGRLGDAFGRRELFVGGLLAFMVGAVASALAPSVAPLVVGRLAQGLGAGFISAQVLGIIQDTAHGSARVRALGAYSAVGALAAIVGPLVAGVLLWVLPSDLGWRLVLVAPVPFAAVAAWRGLRSLPRSSPARLATGLDVPGIVLLGAIVVAVTLPVIDPGMPGPLVVGTLGVVAILVVALMLWERGYARRSRLPLFAPALLRSAGFVAGNVVALLWFGSLLALSTVIAVFFLQADQLPAFVIAAGLVPASLARLFTSRASSAIFARFGPAVVAAGLAIELVCLLALVAATLVWDGGALFAAIVVIQIAMGFAGGLVEPALRAVTLGFAPATLHGVAASFLQLTQRLSATFFVALATGIVLGVGAAPTTGSLRVAVVVCAGAVSVALGVAWWSRRGRVAGSGARTDERPVLPAVSPPSAGLGGSGDTGVMTVARTEWLIERVDWSDERAVALRAAMDDEIAPRYAEVFASFDDETAALLAQDFAVDPTTIVEVVLVLDDDGEAVGHAALRALGDELEVKRVFVHRRARGHGASRALMAALEELARARGAGRLILQTGDRQPEAIALYERIGYHPIETFPPYVRFAGSRCFAKTLTPARV